MAIFVLRLEDKIENVYQSPEKRLAHKIVGKEQVRFYLWKGLDAAGMLCRHTKFFRTRSEAEKALAKVNTIWPTKKFSIQPAFAD